MQPVSSQSTSPQSTSARPTHARHVVLALTVAAYFITYMDRVVFSTAVPEIRKELGISLVQMGAILAAFRYSYAIFQVPGGWLGDKIGPRRALTLIVGWWSILTSLTAAGWNVASMYAIRFIFGIGEAGAFPIATRSLSRWILPSERGFAQGITHAGSRLGGVVAPVVAFMILRYGWRMPFWTFGIVGLIWSAVWFLYYRDTPEQHHGVNAAELEKIHAATGGPGKPVGSSVPWGRILANPVVWQISLMYICYQYSLAWYTDWFPTYLKESRGFSSAEMGTFTGLSWIAGAIGNVSGGWLTDLVMQFTGDVRRSRRVVGIFGFVIAALGILSSILTKDPKLCVYLNWIAFAGLEVTVSVSWAIPLDIAGDYAGSAAAVMNCCGNLGGGLSSQLVPYMVKASGWSMPLVVASALAVLGALIYTRIDASRRIIFA